MVEYINEHRVNAILIEDQKANNGAAATVKVSISVDPLVEPMAKTGDMVRVSTIEVTEYLAKKGYNIAKCLKSAVVTNTNIATIFGEWIFELEPLPYGLKELPPASKMDAPNGPECWCGAASAAESGLCVAHAANKSEADDDNTAVDVASRVLAANKRKKKEQ